MKSPLRLPDFRYTKTTLSNGLDVIACRQDHLPVVAVNLWYHVGSKNEERRQRGFAHLFEHLMFEGSEHYPGDFFKPLQRLGAGINGSTSADRTNYYEDVPAAHVELAVAMESDRMANLIPALTDTKLRVQKDVVKNEYRQNYANRPYGQVGRLLAEALYPPSHPYSWLTIGVMEDVEAATREDVEAFFRRFYVPSNASLCLAGAIDEDRVLALAERYFGDIAGGTKALLPRAPEPSLDADVTIRVVDRVELDRIYDSWHTVRQFHDDDAPLMLLGDILARGRSSRLYRKLVVEEGLAQGVSAYQSGRELAGTFNAIATLRPGKSPEQARGLILVEIAAIAERGVAPEERERVLNGRLAGFVYALENIGGFGGVADRLNAYNTYLGDPSRITSDFQRYQARHHRRHPARGPAVPRRSAEGRAGGPRTQAGGDPPPPGSADRAPAGPCPALPRAEAGRADVALWRPPLVPAPARPSGGRRVDRRTGRLLGAMARIAAAWPI